MKVRRTSSLFEASLASSSELDEEYIAFLQSLWAPSTKPHDADQLMEMLGPSHRAYNFQTSSCSHDSGCLY